VTHSPWRAIRRAAQAALAVHEAVGYSREAWGETARAFAFALAGADTETRVLAYMFLGSTFRVFCDRATVRAVWRDIDEMASARTTETERTALRRLRRKRLPGGVA